MSEKTKQKPSHKNNENALSHPLAVLIRVKSKNGCGNGSGFFVREELIVTNIHVVALATSVSVELIDPKTELIIREFAVKGVTAFDTINDLVILRIDGEGNPLHIGDSDSVKSGDIVQTVGYPDGKFKVTNGPIHSIRNYDKWIRMKGKTSGGNSGGPVLNSNEQVIGIAVRSEEYYTLVIPANTLKPMLSQSQPEESFTQWRERKQEVRAYTHLLQSQINLHYERYDDALTDLDKAVELYPEFALIFYKRGTLKYVLGETKEKDNKVEAQHHYQDAINDYTEAIRLCPDFAEVFNNRANAKLLLGKSETTSGNGEIAHHLNQAAIDSNTSIKLDPNNALFYCTNGLIKYTLGNYDASIDDYTEAIRLCPDFADAYNSRADAKLLFGKSETTSGNGETEYYLNQAIIDSNTSIKLDPNNALFYHTRGQIKYALGDSCAAIDDYEKALEIDPNYTDVLPDLELAQKAKR